MPVSIYPKSPDDLPKRLTSLPFSYHLKATLAIFSIVLFFILYAALVLTSLWLVYGAIIFTIPVINQWTILMKIGAIAGSIMLFLFTLKFILNLKNYKPENRIRLTKEEQPKLWEFVLSICKEAGAPKPKNIYVDPDVNAYVAYSNMWLSLFLPVRKELTIGMGLVSCLNLSEFKAVVSHEFGHFAQRSMKIGGYIISANTIIHDMIYTRDKWDDLLDKWRSADLRLSFAAWIITPMIWVIRKLLNLFYLLLNIMYSSLSREMEFNADKVAVSTSGSEAIVSGLWRLDSGLEAWNKTLNNAYLAAQKQMYVKNLYAHNKLRIADKSEVIKCSINNLQDDPKGGKRYFISSENSKVSMYASHPANDQREHNAKVPFVGCESDDRSPWLLFVHEDQVQEQMTALVYSLYWNKKPESYMTEQEFEGFIKEEARGSELLEEYDNTFEGRFLQIPEEEELEQAAEVYDRANGKNLDELKQELQQLMKPVREIEALMQKAQQIVEGTIKEKQFAFKGITYKKKTLQDGYNLLTDERERLFNETFKEWDRSFCAYHLVLAKKYDKQEPLFDLYRQHTTIVGFYKKLVATRTAVFTQLHTLQTREEVLKSDIQLFQKYLKDWIADLNQDMEALDKIHFLPMPNIDTTAELKGAIIEGGSFKVEEGPIFENGGFDRLVNNLENALVHCQRIDQKSIGVILSFHKELALQLTRSEVNRVLEEVK